jgi:hypothetical protein
MSFTDTQVLVPRVDSVRPLPEAAIGTVNPGRSLAAQRAYLAAFFGLHPHGQRTDLFDGDSPAHPDTRIVG